MSLIHAPPPSSLPAAPQNPEMCQLLADSVERTLEHAIVNEEKIPLDQVTNLQEVCQGESETRLYCRYVVLYMYILWLEIFKE